MATDGALAHDPTRDTAWHRPDDRFVPLRARELTEALAADAATFGLAPDDVHALAAALHEVIEQETAAFERGLDELYAFFNPDRDTQPVRPLCEQRTPAAYAQLDAWLAYLLGKANYTALDEVQIEEAVQTANAYGLRVRLRPERITSLRLWVRGQGCAARVRRDWRHIRHWRTWKQFIRGTACNVPVYRRLAVIARLKDDPHVIIKLFKDIPKEDIEALLPHAEADMSLLDRLMVFGSGAGALGSVATKLIAFITTGSIVALQFLWVLTVGAGLLLYRTFMGYRRARTSRAFQQTQHLYFQNLANNAAALQTLVATVTQEEIKEALLAYVFCHAPNDPPATEHDVDQRVEAYLARRFGATLNFDCGDAFDTLTRLKLLATRTPPRVVPAETALDLLQAHWQAGTTRAHHATTASAALTPV